MIDSLVFGAGVIAFDKAQAMSLTEIEDAFDRAAAWHEKARKARR